jgi:cardiolipin synthase (CMP-forming)
MNIVDDHYRWAMALFVLAGISDALDGLLARLLHQKTVLGQYLDPIADKLLLSGMFLVLSIVHKIPWKFTVLVFSRDICILLTAAVLYATNTLREFSPSVFGKANTFAQVVTVFLVLLREIARTPGVAAATTLFLWLTFAFTILSGLHYVYLTGQRLKAQHTRAAGHQG